MKVATALAVVPTEAPEGVVAIVVLAGDAGGAVAVDCDGVVDSGSGALGWPLQ